jgi:hypothetical protein
MKRYLTTGCLIFSLSVAPAQALSLGELQGEAKLTPKKFAGHFGNFTYKFTEEVQAPDIFLRSKVGDCDDYAILADLVLQPKGFGTRLILIRMPGLVTHCVCYVGEEKGYLDYNNRTFLVKIERSGSTLLDIATKVAKSFDANWTTASEFIYLGDSMKQLVSTVSKTGKVVVEAVPKEKSGRQIKIDF